MINSLCELFKLSVDRNKALKKRPDGRWLRSREKRLIRKLRTNWRRQRDFVLDEIKGLKFLEEKEENAMKDNVAPGTEIQDLIDKIPQKTSITNVIVVGMGASMSRSGKKAVKDFGLAKFGISFSLENPTAKRILKDKKTLELSNFRGNIHKTTKTGIKDLLTRASEKGESLGKVSQRIRDQYDQGVFSVARGELIAQTELGRSYGDGAKIVMDEADDTIEDQTVEKKWNTLKDDRVRSSHRSNENEGWIWTKQSHKGTDEQTAPSTRDFGCRCVEIYRVVDTE